MNLNNPTTTVFKACPQCSILQKKTLKTFSNFMVLFRKVYFCHLEKQLFSTVTKYSIVYVIYQQYTYMANTSSVWKILYMVHVNTNDKYSIRQILVWQILYIWQILALSGKHSLWEILCIANTVLAKFIIISHFNLKLTKKLLSVFPC